jgi:PilZ domain-containing protein
VDSVQTPPSYPRPRRYPRLELSAFVELRRGDERRPASAPLHLPVRNISRGGVLVGDGGEDLSAFVLGEAFFVTIVDASGDIDAAAHVEGRVVRHDAGGMALSWDDSDGGIGVVGAFLDRFYSKR